MIFGLRRVVQGASAAVIGRSAAPRAAAAAVWMGVSSGPVQRRTYHKLRGGIGNIMGAEAEPDWQNLPSKAERLFSRLGKKENGGLGPDLFRRDMGGTGVNVKPLTYEPTLGTSFPRIGEIDSVNFEQTLEAKEAYVRSVRNASQPLGPVALDHTVQILDEDVRCGSARFDFHFTDITKEAAGIGTFNNDNRRIFVREKTGVLRTASQEERDRANQEFYAGKHEKAWLPQVFKDQKEYFTALESFTHPYLLDEICRIRSPTSADYVRVHEWTYNHVAEKGVFQVLQDTPHFFGFARWIFEEDMVGRLLVPLLKDGRLADAADLVVAYCEFRAGKHPLVDDIESVVTATLRQRMPPASTSASSSSSGGGAAAQQVKMAIAIPFKWVGDVNAEALRREAMEMHERQGGSSNAIEVQWEREGELAVEGSPALVQTVADSVFRSIHADALPQIYLKAYSTSQEYADMRKLVSDALEKANIDGLLQ